MQLSDPGNFHKRQFAVSKEQLIHDLTIVKLMKSDIDISDDFALYDTYIRELDHVRAVVEDRTRYELQHVEPANSWNED